MLGIALTEVGSRTDAGDAHLAHMTLHSFAIDDEVIVLLEHHGDAARAIRRLLGVNTVNGMLDGDFLGRGRNGLIVEAASAQAEQLRLVGEWKLSITALDQGETLTSAQGQGQIFYAATRLAS